jgi:hypothetical protein
VIELINQYSALRYCNVPFSIIFYTKGQGYVEIVKIFYTNVSAIVRAAESIFPNFLYALALIASLLT